MLKLGINFNVLADVECVKENFSPLCKFPSFRDVLSQKNLQKNLVSCKVVYITLSSIYKNFKSKECELTIPIAFFFPAEYENQSHFHLSRPALPNFYVKSLQSNKNIDIF